jgi:tetraacyldisaccharide 4'-kinase
MGRLTGPWLSDEPMNASTERFIHRLLSGEARGVVPAAARFGLAMAEPFYAGAMTARNWLYDRAGLRSHRLKVPVLSVGNITAGGTGKTPLVRWLATRLRDLGLRPAVLLRGYRRDRADISDEQFMLQQYLGDTPVHAEGDRVAGGQHILSRHPDVNIILLDDGFQHRRLARDFDLVLIDAANPLGYGHVHPRGLLREPLGGLRRADAFVLTRSDLISHEQREEIESTLRGHNSIAPIYRARHAHTGLRSAGLSASAPPDLALDHLAGRRFFAFAGVGQPHALHQQLSAWPGSYVGHHWFADHHAYSASDLLDMRKQAAAAGAELILVTEKDWTKLHRLPSALAGAPPILRLELEIHLAPQAATGLLELIQTRIERSR